MTCPPFKQRVPASRQLTLGWTWRGTCLWVSAQDVRRRCFPDSSCQDAGTRPSGEGLDTARPSRKLRASRMEVPPWRSVAPGSLPLRSTQNPIFMGEKISPCLKAHNACHITDHLILLSQQASCSLPGGFYLSLVFWVGFTSTCLTVSRAGTKPVVPAVRMSINPWVMLLFSKAAGPPPGARLHGSPASSGARRGVPQTRGVCR